ncbi:MAG: hypothetical protein ACYTG5_02140 [Planctomycetota bacterium]
MTTRIDSSGSVARSEQDSTPCTGTAPTRASAQDASGNPIEIESSMRGTARGRISPQTGSSASPDPMFATDRYRLVTPYKLRL